MRIDVLKSDIKIVKDELIVSGTNKCYNIEFRFDRSWKDMINKTAVFYQPTVNPGSPIYKLIGDNNKVVIPSASLVPNDQLYIGVFGFTAEGEIRLSTVYTYTYVRRGCYATSEEPEPEPSVYEDIYLMALNAVNTAQDVENRANAGEFDGFSPYITVKEDTPREYVLTVTNRDNEYDTPNLIPDEFYNTYVYTQHVPSSEWIIVHELGKYPSVTVVDSSGTGVVGDVSYIDENILKIEFSAKFSGTAYLN